MFLTPYSDLNWAYQLHYYVCFQAYKRQPLFITDDRISLLLKLLEEICGNHDYHLLQSKINRTYVGCLLSLRPSQAIATVIQKLKGNLSREYNVSFATTPPLWARGYLARSVGRVRVEAVKHYLENQAEHHGYDKRLRPPVFVIARKELLICRQLMQFLT